MALSSRTRHNSRTTVYNKDLTTDIEWQEVNPLNRALLKSFVSYLVANDKSDATIKQYLSQLKIFFTWNLRENLNRFFVDIKKRDFVNFFGYGRNELGWSPNRLASMRSVLSSLSNYIENILDDEYPTFRNVVKVLEPIKIEPVREKTILSCEMVENTLDYLKEKNEIQMACWLALLYSSGIRRTECTQIKVEFFQEQNIVFDLMYKTSKIRTKGSGKKGKQVSRYVFKYTFEPYLKAWLEEREKLGIKSEYLFVTRNGNGEYIPAKISTFNTWAQRLSVMMEINFYPHCMRHLWTTKLMNAGYPASIIQKLQNWASVDMVSVYDDTTDEDLMGKFFENLKKIQGE